MTVLVVITRNGYGDAWLFGSLPDARTHPIPQMDDVYATGPDQLVAQYGRGHADALLRFTEGRDRSAFLDAIEEWKQADRTATLRPEARELIWNRVYAAAKEPPANPKDIVRIVTEDRQFREGRTLRSLPDPDRSASTEVNRTRNDDMADAARKTKVPDSHVIKITTEGGKNPKREGTPSAERFALYKNGMTVAEAKKAGVRAADITYDSDKSYISLTANPAAEKAAADAAAKATADAAAKKAAAEKAKQAPAK